MRRHLWPRPATRGEGQGEGVDLAARVLELLQLVRGEATDDLVSGDRGDRDEVRLREESGRKPTPSVAQVSVTAARRARRRCR